MSKNRIVGFLKTYYWIIGFFILLFAFSWKIFVKGYVLGPYDFLAGFYHPFRDTFLNDPKLQNLAAQYKNFLMSDVVTVIMPVQLMLISFMKHGQIPLWNPYNLNGTPLLANVQSSVLYPLNILYFIFDQATAANIYNLLQLILAFFFFYLYMRALRVSKLASYLGALSFSFSSFFIVWLPWGTLGHALLWLPFNLYAIEMFTATGKRRYTLYVIAGLVLSFFAGHTQVSSIVYLLTFIYVLIKIFSGGNHKLIPWLFIIFIITGLLIGPQLIPSVEMYNLSPRQTLATESFYRDQTLYFSSFIQTLFPDFFGNPVTLNWWGKINYAESAIYFGISAFYFLLYALLNRRRIKPLLWYFCLFLLVAGILLSTQNPVSRLLFELKLPIFSSSTFARNTVIYIFAATVISSFGIMFFFDDIRHKTFKKIHYLNAAILLFFAGYWIVLLLHFVPKEYAAHLGIIKRNSILPTAIMFLFISSFYVMRILRKPKWKSYSLFILFLIIIMTAERFRFAYKFTPFAPRAFFYPQQKVLTELHRLTSDGRYYNFIPSNINSYYRVYGVEGSEPLYNKRYAQLASLSDNALPDLSDRASVQIPDGPYKLRVLDLLTAKYMVDEANNLEHADYVKYLTVPFEQRFKQIWTDGRIRIYENSDALNRTMMFYKTEHIPDSNQILRRLVDKNFNPKDTVVLETSTKNRIEDPGQYTIHQLVDDPLLLRFEVTTNKAGVFLLNDTYYPGWHALVDNKETPIMRANYAFRAVEISPGTHTVVFRYSPDSFKTGVAMFALGLVLLILYGFKPLWVKHSQSSR